MNKRPNEFGRFGRFSSIVSSNNACRYTAQTFRHHAICLKFNGIVERGQFERIAATVKGLCDKIVGNLRVFRQQRTMQVGSNKVALMHALKAVFAIVAERACRARGRAALASGPSVVRPP